MISFENINQYMFNIIICELLPCNNLILFGKNYMYSYYKPIIEWNCEPESFYNKHYQNVILYKSSIIFISKRLNFSWLKKWKLGIKEFICLNDNGCCDQCDFSNLNIKLFWIESKRNIIKFSNNVEEIIYLNNILDISKLKDLKNLKKIKIYDCKFSKYEKFYSNILFDKLIINRNFSCNDGLIDITVNVNLSAQITFNCYDNLDYDKKRFFYKQLLKIKKNNFCNVKYIILKNADLNYNFMKFFNKLDRLDLINTVYDLVSLKNIILNNVNLYSLTLSVEDDNGDYSKYFESRKEILNYFN
jgi:hypothetical protein